MKKALEIRQLYKFCWMKKYNPGCAVYRDLFDLSRCTLEEGVSGHLVALFIDDNEAENYCEYRNYMLMKYNTDDVDFIIDFK